MQTHRFKHIVCFIAVALLLIVSTPVALAQAPQPPELAQNAAPLDTVAQITMPTVDVDKAVADHIERLEQGHPPRFATAIDVNITPETHGTWETLADGTRLWRLRIASPGALSLNLAFTRYWMPVGGKLFNYSPDYSQVIGPFDYSDNEEHGELWTPMIDGEEMVIEVQLPAATAQIPTLKLTAVNHGFLEFGKALLSGSCNVDVMCGAADGYPQVDAWRDEMRSSGAYTVGGVDYCSGALINNTAQDMTSYFLTADHCEVDTGNQASVVIYWNYKNSYCRPPGSAESGNPGDGSKAEFNSGVIFRADYPDSDFTLVEMDDPLDPAHNLYWAGWDRSDATTTSAIAIHHPGVEEMRISFEDDATEITSYLGSTVPGDSTHLRVVDWDLGTTEGGSSGSPLFSPEHRIIGQLHGGYAACGNDDSDWYGRVFVSWTGGGTSDSRLSDWLDPVGTGATTLDGRGMVQLPTGTMAGNVTNSSNGNPIGGASIIAAGTYPTQTGTTLSQANGDYTMDLLVGTYTVTATAFGYQQETLSGIPVISGTTTTQDIALTPVASYTLSGTVTDANTGWGLFAKVEVVPEGYPAQDYWTNPWTGNYSITLVGGYNHTINVETWAGLPGYETQSRQVNLSANAVEDFALDVNSLACNAPGYELVGGFKEDFDSVTPNALPEGWATETVTATGSGTEATWATYAGLRYPGGGYAAHSEPNIAYLNAYDASAGKAARLYTTAGLDMTSFTGSDLTFWMFHDTGYTSSDDRVQVQVSTDGGTTWNDVGAPISRYEANSNAWAEHTVSLSAYSAETDLLVGFLGLSEYGNDVNLDDIVIGDTPTCTPPSGSLLAGSVYDGNNSAHLTGAEIQNSLDDIVTAQETPGNNYYSEAFYVIYAPLGTQPFTATLAKYQGTSVNYPVIAGGITYPQDFYLQAGYPQVTPDALHVTINEGASTTLQLNVANGNSAVAFDFEFKERDNGFDPAKAGEDILVVNESSALANAVEAVLDTLGYTYAEVSNTAYTSMDVADLLTYKAVIYCGTPSTSGEQPKTIEYLDAGGRFMVIDNNFAYFYCQGGGVSNSDLGVTYLQCVNEGSAGAQGQLTGQDIMAGINPDLSAASSPDSYSFNGSEAVSIFAAPDGNSAGSYIARNDYRALMLSWYLHEVSVLEQEDILENALGWLIGWLEVPWVSTTPVSDTVAASGLVPVTVAFDSSAVAEAGNYYAILKLETDSPYPATEIPVTMTVLAADVYTSTGAGDWSNMGNWMGNHGTPPTASDNVGIAAGSEITVDAASGCLNLTIEADAKLNIPEGITLTVHGTVANHGTLAMTHDVPDVVRTDYHLYNGSGTPVYYGVELAPNAAMGSTLVEIQGNTECTTADAGDTVNRCVSVTPGFSTPANLRVYYLDSEADGITPASARLWEWNGTWQEGTGQLTGTVPGGYYAEAVLSNWFNLIIVTDNVTGPNAITLSEFTSHGGFFAPILGLVAAGWVYTRKHHHNV